MNRILRLLSVALALAAGAWAQSAATKAYFTLHTLAPGVMAAIAVPGSGAGSNAGIIIGDDGVCVVDTFQNVDAARALLAAIRAQTALPVRYVVNTHYHLDHVTGNQIFADAGATIFAQRNVRSWIHTENLKFLGPNPDAARRAMVESLRAPDVVYTDGIELYLGSRHLVVRVLPGHTGGDSAVWVDGTSVVFTGDLFWNHTLPNLVDANTTEQMASLEQLRGWPPGQGIFVPGHGEVGTAADVAAFRGYLADLRDAVAQAQHRGENGAALTADVQVRLQPKYGDWAWFTHFIGPNATDTDAELRGKKQFPQP